MTGSSDTNATGVIIPLNISTTVGSTYSISGPKVHNRKIVSTKFNGRRQPRNTKVKCFTKENRRAITRHKKMAKKQRNKRL